MNTVLTELKTPAYIIDEQVIEKNCVRLKQVKDQSGCKILLATKAYSCFTTYPLIAKYLDGTTNSSLNEARLSSETFTGETHVYAPAYIPEEFDPLCQFADYIIFNSIAQWQRYKGQVPAYIHQGLRLNPEHTEVQNPMYNPCAPGSRFGILAEELNTTSLDGISGVHIHALCQHNDDSFERLLNATQEKFKDLLKKDSIRWVNFGGGHMITRPEYNQENLVRLIKTFQETFQVQVILEPGEAVVYQAGVLQTRVLDIVQNKMAIAIVDTSATAHMPDILEMPYTPTIQSAAEPNKKPYTYRIGGNTCLSGDIIGEYSFDQPLQIGQDLIIEDMAQYTMVKNTSFNGLNKPTIYIKRLMGELCEQRSFDYRQFKDNLG